MRPSQDDDAESAVKQLHGGQDPLLAVFCRAVVPDQMADQLAVGGREEQVPFVLQPGADLVRVDQVAVVGNGERPEVVRHPERLEVFRTADIRSRIPDMPDAGSARQGVQIPLVEHLTHQSRSFLEPDLSVRSERGDPAALLPPVLEFLEGDEGLACGIPDAESREHAALLVDLAI